MKAKILETGVVLDLPRIAIESDDLVQGNVTKVDNPDYDFEMPQADYNWWKKVQKGADIAEANPAVYDTTDYTYEDYIMAADDFSSEDDI